MKISEITDKPNLEKMKKEENFLSSMFDTVFMICQHNSNFTNTNTGAEKLETQLKEIKIKLKKQDKLLIQSTEMKQDLTRKCKTLVDENFNTRARLLEILGSEI